MIDDYLRRLRAKAARAGIEPDRLVAEVSDHLLEAAARHEAAGRTRGDAELLATGNLGDPQEIVSSVATLGGGPMSKIRTTTALLGVAAMAALWSSHVWPSSDVVNTSFEPIAIAALGLVMSVTAILLMTENRVAGACAALLGGGVTWAFATSALQDHGIVISNVSFTLPAAGLAAGLLCAAAHVRGALGFAAMASGSAALVLNGSWGPVGGLGGGEANFALFLVTAGWAWVVATRFVLRVRIQAQLDRTRAAVAATLEWAARRIAPEPTP